MTYESVLIALADPSRRAVFEALKGAPKPVVALAKDLPISRPAVSQHLKVLENAGLVRATPKGASRLYEATPEGLLPLRQYLDAQWGGVLQAFADHVTQQMETKDD